MSGGAALLNSLSACDRAGEQPCDGGLPQGTADNAAQVLLQAAAEGSPGLALQGATDMNDDSTMHASLTDLKARMNAVDVDPSRPLTLMHGARVSWRLVSAVPTGADIGV